MSNAEDGPERVGDLEGTELVLYDVSVALPLIAGTSAWVAAGILIFGPNHRPVGLEIAYFLAVALLVGGIVAYFVIGMWLLPASMIVAGLLLFAANQALVYRPNWSLEFAVAFGAVGSLGIVWAVTHMRRNPTAGGSGS